MSKAILSVAVALAFTFALYAGPSIVPANFFGGSPAIAGDFDNSGEGNADDRMFGDQKFGDDKDQFDDFNADDMDNMMVFVGFDDDKFDDKFDDEFGDEDFFDDFDDEGFLPFFLFGH